MKPKILMLDKHNEKKEIEFEVEYLLSLTRKERFTKFFGLEDFVLKLAKNHGNRRIDRTTGKIVQRK